MTVAELIKYLQTQPQSLPVVIPQFSEYCALIERGVRIIEATPARADGWVQRARPDMAPTYYLAIGD